MVARLVELTVKLSETTFERLRAEAEHKQIPLDEVLEAALETYLQDDEEEYEDTPDEKILEDFRQAWHEAMTGQIGTQSARELLEEIRRELDEDNAQ
ncbi:MAG: hypothetical protein H7175_14845 [Burkholderiales bacterium]|nr:hypothetical protein [Anaerolineae bacterium]